MSKETRTAYGETLKDLALQREDIIVMDADLSGATKTNIVQQAVPSRHINAGIAEGDMIGMAAGLAASGKTVFASSFAMFAAGRAFEQIRNSVAYPHLNVKVCATHAGLSVGEDGASHQAIEDIALMRSVPNMEVYNPCDQFETAAVIKYVADTKLPTYVRLGRSKVEDVYNADTQFNFDIPTLVKQGNSKVLVIATGLMVQEALKASEQVDITVVDLCRIKPLNTQVIVDLCSKYDAVVTCEEHSVIGGLYSAICEILCQNHPMKVVPIGVNDTFGESGKANDVLAKYGLTADHIVEVVKSL